MGPSLPHVLRAARHAGLRHRCPVCRSWLRRFAVPAPGSPQLRCPVCGSLQRHRHLWLFLERETDLPRRPGRILHLAPEAGLGRRLRRLAGAGYLSGDLVAGRAMRRLDLTRLDLPDASFDWVLCSHVLEHVGDDAAAMRELCRVLRPGGTAVVGVPVHGEHTDEDPGETDPAERLRRFGQDDHVRIYGRDVMQRLAAAGFEVEPVVFRDQLTRRERERFGLRYPNLPWDFDVIDDVWQITLCRRPVGYR